MIFTASSSSSKIFAKPFQDVDPLLQLGQLELEAPPHRLLAELDELAQHRREIDAQRPGDLLVVGRHQAGQVDVEPGLQRRVLEQVRHHQVGSRPASAPARCARRRSIRRARRPASAASCDDHLGDALDRPSTSATRTGST
jgi:hypothetical protein